MRHVVTVIVTCPQAVDEVGPSGKGGFSKMRLVRRWSAPARTARASVARSPCSIARWLPRDRDPTCSRGLRTRLGRPPLRHRELVDHFLIVVESRSRQVCAADPALRLACTTKAVVLPVKDAMARRPCDTQRHTLRTRQTLERGGIGGVARQPHHNANLGVGSALDQCSDCIAGANPSHGNVNLRCPFEAPLKLPWQIDCPQQPHRPFPSLSVGWRWRRVLMSFALGLAR